MPIVGLRGFIIGRTDAMLSTKEVKAHPAVPDDAELLYPGSFHGRKSTRFSTRRHFKIPPQILYNPLSNPPWVFEAEREAVLIKSSRMEAVEQSYRGDCDDRSSVGLIGLDHAGWRHRHRFYARTSGSFSNPNSSQAGDMSPIIPLDFRVKEGQAADEQWYSQGEDLAGFKEGTEQVVDVGSLRHDSNLQESNKYVRSSTRGHRSSRRPRNRIREEAGKESEARARKIQKLQTQTSDASVNSWNPFLRMCRSVLLLKTSSAQKF